MSTGGTLAVLMMCAILVIGTAFALIIYNHERHQDEFRRWCTGQGGTIVEVTPLVCINSTAPVIVRTR